MDIILRDPREEIKTATLEKEMKRILDGMLRTIWNFSEGKTMAVYLLLDPPRGKVLSFVNLGGLLIPPERLHEVPKNEEAGIDFSDDPAHLASLQEYLQGDLKSLVDLFKARGFMVPARLLSAVFIPEDRSAMKVYYVVRQPHPEEPEISLQTWMQQVAASRQPGYLGL